MLILQAAVISSHPERDHERRSRLPVRSITPAQPNHSGVPEREGAMDIDLFLDPQGNVESPQGAYLGLII